MREMISHKVLLCVLFVVLILPFTTYQVRGAQPSQFSRSVSIPVKVVLIGFDAGLVDLSYLSWSGSSKNLPSSITNLVLDSGNSTGTVFHPDYTFTFAPVGFKQDFESYLHSIEKSVNGKDPWFQEYVPDKKNSDYYTTNPVAVNYVVYDANSVEDWLWNHAQTLGGVPSNGWTIIVSYLPELPSVTWSDVKAFEKTNGGKVPKSKPHYYGISSTDSDLGYSFRYRDFMNAWGGHHRMWFVDLSAGPVQNSRWEDIPLQVALGDNNIDLTLPFGKSWMTEYIADYVWQATANFITPDFVYSPEYSPQYKIDVFVMDDRSSSEKNAIPIERTVDQAKIVSAFQDLVPYSQIKINVNFQDTPSELHQLIASNYKFADSWIYGNVFGSPQRYGIVDMRPVYKYILMNLATFEKNPRMTGDTITIPVFAFALTGQTYFTYAYKWDIGKQDWETGALLGIALPEAAFISLNQWEFTRGNEANQRGKGDGFTETIIHETGHEFGLMHPHQYGDIGDFIYSAMGYFTNDYGFGQIDKDALQRAHADELYFKTTQLLSELSSTPNTESQTLNKLNEAQAAYDQMNYTGAVSTYAAAYQEAKQAAPQQTSSQNTILPITLSNGNMAIYLAVGIIVGVIVGFAVANMVTRRRRGPETKSSG